MAIPTMQNTGSIIRLSNDAMDTLLKPIPEDDIIEIVASLKGWKTKRVEFEDGQSKREYFYAHFGKNMTLELLRQLRVIREHNLIGNYSWRIYSWNKSINRYYPDKIEQKFEDVLLDFSSMVNLDRLVVNEDSKTVFVLLEQWQKEIVADTFLSRVETNVPKYFRAYLCLSKKIILIEEKSQLATEQFVKIFEKAFNVTTEEIRINAMVIRAFVRKIPGQIKRLVVKVQQEVAGFGGLTELSFMGSDVIGGARGLMTRHETSPIDVGPWTGVSSATIDLDVGKPITVRSISAILWLLELLEELY